MYSNLGVQRYKEADINSMTKEKMIILLYEKVESDLVSAVAAVHQGDSIEMTRKVNHSQRIVCELRGALDHEIGGEISRNLESLYDYMFHEQLQVIIDRDPVHLDNCLRVLRPLLDSWRRIPAGTAEQTQRETTRNGPSGPNPALNPQENAGDDSGAAEDALGVPRQPLESISLSV